MAGRTVVFDEVHAYDVYMSDVHTRLLEWLRAVNANVVILSATLPSAVRARIAAVYGDRTASVQVLGKSRTVELLRTDDILAAALAYPGARCSSREYSLTYCLISVQRSARSSTSFCNAIT